MKRPTKHRVVKRILTITILTVVICGTSLIVWLRSSPWPSTMIMRRAFEATDAVANQALAKYAPDNISITSDIQFDTNDSDAYLDIYYSGTANANPATVVWAHGGGWIYGHKGNVNPWARILAGRGFNVVAVNYSLAPEHTYPVPVQQLNRALGYLDIHQSELGINANQIVLGGSSAGSHIVAQLALLTVSPDYSSAIGIAPTVGPNQIKGLLLNCGPFDIDLVEPNTNTPGAVLMHSMLWAYTGNKNFHDDPAAKLMSIPQNLVPEFPPSFVTAGNGDPLLPHSQSLALALNANNVSADILFFPDGQTPAIGHEYQFVQDIPEGRTALERMVEFINKYTKE